MDIKLDGQKHINDNCLNIVFEKTTPSILSKNQQFHYQSTEFYSNSFSIWTKYFEL